MGDQDFRLPGREGRLGVLLTLGLIAAFTVLNLVNMDPLASADLLALWLAASEVARGNPGGIYPLPGEIFTMHPPEGWAQLAAGMGHEEAIYPYIYPPIWVWLLAPLTRVLEFADLVLLASVINPVLICLTLLLARRLAAPGMSQPFYLALGLALLIPSVIGVVALMQNQPQILVAFLTLLAIERDAHDQPLTGGLLMGLAAALKVYPALYALVWLAQGRWRALAGFVLSGGTLGLISLGLAGWPLHAWFLDLLDQIYATAMVTHVSFSLTPAVVQLVQPDLLLAIQAETATEVPDSETGSWLVAAVPAWLQMLLKAAVFLAAIAGGLMLRHSPERARGMIWPALMIFLALLSPLSWAYHYLAPVAFVPALFAVLPPRTAVVAVAAGIAPTFIAFFPLINELLPGAFGSQVTGTTAMAILGLVFFFSRHRAAALPG